MSDGVKVSGKAKDKANNNSTNKNNAPDLYPDLESPVGKILSLHRTIGNGAMQNLIESGIIQPKLKIGKPGDIYEQEADRIAEQVMRMTVGSREKAVDSNENTIQKEEKEEIIQKESLSSQESSFVQRQVGEEERKKREEEEFIQPKLLSNQTTSLVQRQLDEEERKKEEEEWIQPRFFSERITPLVQRQVEDTEKKKREEEMFQAKERSSGGTKASADVESSIDNLRGKGEPLPESTKNYFELRFGYDFSGVKIHTGSEAVDTARSIDARAFTVGNDVVFGSSSYSLETKEGRKLLAHELTHVVQQNKGSGEQKTETIHPLSSTTYNIQRANGQSIGGLKWKQWCMAYTYPYDEYIRLRAILEEAKYKFIIHVRNKGGEWEKKKPSSETPASDVGWSIGAPDGSWYWATTSNVVKVCEKLIKQSRSVDNTTYFNWLMSEEGHLFFRLRQDLKDLGYEFIPYVRTYAGEWSREGLTLNTPVINVAWSIGSPDGNWYWATRKNVVSICGKIMSTAVRLGVRKYPYDSNYGPSAEHCAVYQSPLAEIWFTYSYRNNAECACLRTPNEPHNNCVRKCLQVKMRAHLKKQNRMGRALPLTFPLEADPMCHDMWEQHVECYRECGCNNKFINYPTFSTMCRAPFPCFAVAASIDWFNACIEGDEETSSPLRGLGPPSTDPESLEFKMWLRYHRRW